MKYTFLIIGLLLMCFFCGAQVNTPRPDTATLNKLKKHFERRFRYPDEEMKNKPFGKVVLRFTLNKDKVIEAVSVVKSVSALCDQYAIDVVRNASSYKMIDLAEGVYSLAVNYRLMDNGKLLEEKSKTIKDGKESRFLFTADVLTQLPRTEVRWIVDRWPQPNFSGDVKGDVLSMTVSQYYRINGADSLEWKLKFEPPVSNSIIPVPVRGKRQDTIAQQNGSYSIRKFNSKGQVIANSTYESNHLLKSTHEYRYSRNLCIEDKSTLYAADGDSLVIIDQFAYDKDGRKIKENYGVNNQKYKQQIVYQYTDWDEQGNWQKAIRTDADKISHTVKRTLVY